ncbi:HTH-type transcriptional regulator MalT [Rodentibacter trehalosifermentans]|uniref:HTH-type transcriptional regulator MalT n=1 Tax=Rodentibacter trehalosifermentans TaxID=1908263 RepID=UPI0009841258|nr:HTH-type transcriptional regulator MalT [Rodentibacter trehalosifermentans]OOF48416.1 transcriptional regulator MalT [Rodentibacter trehalosifermentans]
MLIPAKLICNDRLQNSVPRTSLLQYLDKSSNYPLVLIHAPAGYGKTTLVSQWAGLQKNVGWYSLDESDNQPDRFASYFIAALQNALKLDVETDESLYIRENLQTLFTQQLVKISAVTEHFYLIIDDYHIINNEEIHEALKYWIRHQPPCMTLILISRSVPPLGIAGLHVQEQLLEINSHLLSFNHQESVEFFQSRFKENITPKEIASLCDEVEGWPTALQLISLSAKQKKLSLKDAAKRLAKLNNFHIYNYLSDEVFAQIDQDTKKFILRCSILRSMNETLVQQVTGELNGRNKLEAIEKQGLFLQQMNAEDNWWRFHPLFASFLTHYCQLELAGELALLHGKAALAWLKLGYTTEALYHAVQLEDRSILLDILSEQGWQLFHQGELKLLEQHLDYLDDVSFVQSPQLILLKAWLAQSQHRNAEVNDIFEHFERVLADQKIHPTQGIQPEFDVLRAQVAINQGDEKTALDLATQALDHLSNIKHQTSNTNYAKIVATSIIGEAYHCQGNFTEALEMLQKAEKMAWKYHTPHNILWALLQQSEIFIAQGFTQVGYDILDKADAFVKENHLQKVPMYEFLLRLKGQILWDWYNLDKAEAMANTGLKVLNKDRDRLQCLALLCKISIVRGDLDNASRLLKQIIDLQNTHDYHQDWDANANQIKIVLWQMLGDIKSVESWLVQTYRPINEKNHFNQVQWRNIARALILLEKYDEAEKILNRVIQTAQKLKLISDLNRALILRNRLYFLSEKKELAQQDLIWALQLTRQTNFISIFVIEGEMMAQQIRQLLHANVLDELTVHKAQFILRNINRYYRHKFAHFDEQFVNNLISNPKVPELLKISPLTQREWQVLGLIYSGYSNEQISEELQVATTTIKSHIRNLYQKIGVANRNEAIDYAKDLLQLMGYR